MVPFSVSDLIVRHPDAPVPTVNAVSFTLIRGETLGIVGESGSGKTTLARALIRLLSPESGSIRFENEDITHARPAALSRFRREVQMVFQDPFASLNPRQKIRKALTTPLAVHGMRDPAEREARARQVLRETNLPDDALERFPHEFSGGQRQRIGIARALILGPSVMICDEPVSALDLSTQAQILNLLVALKQSQNLSYVFISHDLSVVRYFCDRVMVMHHGRIVETVAAATMEADARHPYTRALLDAAPHPGRRKTRNVPKEAETTVFSN